MDVRQEVVEMATPLADELGYEVVDVEYAQAGRRSVVRVYLDRPGGITLDDCAQFSRRLGDLLEMNQTLPHAYVIEVSSPGIERRLRTGAHFQRFVGRRARVETYEPMHGRRHVEGVIRAADTGQVTLALDEGGEWSAPIDAIRVARLVVDPWRERSGRRSTDGMVGEAREGTRRRAGGRGDRGFKESE